MRDGGSLGVSQKGPGHFRALGQCLLRAAEIELPTQRSRFSHQEYTPLCITTVDVPEARQCTRLCSAHILHNDIMLSNRGTASAVSGAWEACLTVAAGRPPPGRCARILAEGARITGLFSPRGNYSERFISRSGVQARPPAGAEPSEGVGADRPIGTAVILSFLPSLTRAGGLTGRGCGVARIHRHGTRAQEDCGPDDGGLERGTEKGGEQPGTRRPGKMEK